MYQYQYTCTMQEKDLCTSISPHLQYRRRIYVPVSVHISYTGEGFMYQYQPMFTIQE